MEARKVFSGPCPAREDGRYGCGTGLAMVLLQHIIEEKEQELLTSTTGEPVILFATC